MQQLQKWRGEYNQIIAKYRLKEVEVRELQSTLKQVRAERIRFQKDVAKKAREVLEETNRVLEKFHAGVAKLRDLYHSSLQEYAEETERTEKEELVAAVQQAEDAWREEIERRVQGVMAGVSEEEQRAWRTRRS